MHWKLWESCFSANILNFPEVSDRFAISWHDFCFLYMFLNSHRIYLVPGNKKALTRLGVSALAFFKVIDKVEPAFGMLPAPCTTLFSELRSLFIKRFSQKS